MFLKNKPRCGGPASDSYSFVLVNITASCFFLLLFAGGGGGGGGGRGEPDEIKTAFLIYALASFHVDCALVGCLAYGINVFATLFRQSDREISIVYGLAAKSAIHDAL